MMQICPKCGKAMDEAARVCPSCHAPNAFRDPEKFNMYIRDRRKRKQQEAHRKQNPQGHRKPQRQKDEAFEREQEQLRILYERQQAERQQQLMNYYREQTKREARAYRKRKRGIRIALSAACSVAILVGSMAIGMAMSNSSEDQETIVESEPAVTSTAAPATEQPLQPTETYTDAPQPAETPEAEPEAEPATPGPSENLSAALGEERYKQTVMVYIIGSDLESQLGAASADMEEIENSVTDDNAVNCIMYTGGSTSWWNDVSSTKNSIYVVKNGKKELEKAEKQKDMSKASTLTQFLNYCFDKYKADKYTLILWDHGGGSIHGYGQDEITDSDSMSLNNLKKALADSDLCRQDKMETIVFDACLMGSTEIAAGLQDYARYFVASEESIADAGLDYSFLKELTQPQMDGSKVGCSIVDSFYEYYSDEDISLESTMTCLDLSKIKAVETSLDKLASKANKDLGHNYKKLKKRRRNLKEYGKVDNFSYDLVDASKMAEKMNDLYPSESEALKDTLQQVVVSCKSTGNNAEGLTLYYPYSQMDYGPASLSIYSDFDFAPNYKKYIQNFLNKSLKSSRSTKGVVKTTSVQTITKAGQTGEKDVRASVTLPQELADRYEKARYYILKEDTEQAGRYLIAGAGEDVSLDQNILSTRVESTIVKIVDKTLNQKYDTSVYLREETDTSKIYSANAVLQRESIALGGHRETQSLNASVRVIQDKKTGECKPLDATINGENIVGMASRIQTDLSQFSSIRYGATRYTPEQNPDGSLKPIGQWKAEDEMALAEYIQGNEYTFEQQKVPDDGTYKIIFEITDDDGQVHMSEIQTVGGSERKEVDGDDGSDRW